MEGLTVRTSRFYFPLVCGFLALAILVRASDPLFVQALRLIAFDTYQRLRPQYYDPELPVRIVDIDQESIARLGQWPWPRTVLRDLVVQLARRNAAVVALDILFAEADRTSLEEVVRRLPSEEASSFHNLIRGPTNDETFAAALGDAPSVLPAILTGRPGSSSLPSKAGFAVAGDDPKPFLPAFAGVDSNLPPLNAAATGLGSINLVPDQDGVIRKIPLFFRIGDEIVPSFAAEALRVAQNASTYVLKLSNASAETGLGRHTGLNHVRIGNFEVATGPASEYTLKFRRSNPSAFIPAWKVLAGEVDEDQISGKVVLVGTSTPGLLDLRTTPLDAALPGVEVQAQIIENVLAGQRLTRPDYAPGIEQLLFVFFGLAFSVLILRLTPGQAAIAGGMMPATIIAGGWICFQYFDLLLDPAYPSLVLLLLSSGATFHMYRQVAAQRSAIRSAFARYLAPAVVEEIIAHPTRLVLGGEKRELSVMFCDVRNFASLSEELTAAEVTTLVNELLTPLSDIILQQRGTIDKYMGDGIMAFWNAPLDVNDHAERACRSAIAMIDIMPALNRHWEQQAYKAGRSFKPIEIGIGINTGECCVGNLGSSQRFDYSAIGDNVNIASRLENLTKLYGVPIVIAEGAVPRWPSFSFIELDLVRVKGRKHPIRVFAPSQLLCDRPAQIHSFIALQKRFLQAYREQRWDDAQALIMECRRAEMRPLAGYYLAGYYNVFLERIRRLREIPLNRDWDGVHAITEFSGSSSSNQG